MAMEQRGFTVFCDVGNVLIETAPLIREATSFATESAASEFDVDPEAFTEAYLTVDSSASRPHMNHLFGDRIVATEALERLTGEADIRYVGAFLSHYRDYVRSQIKPDSEIKSFFRTLADRDDVRVGIISDGTTDDQLDALNRLGVLPYLDPLLVLISEEFGQEKSSSAIYQEALKRSSSSPTSVFMIGDNPERDIRIPYKLGIRTVFFSKYVYATALPEDIRPDHICPNLTECLEYLSNAFQC